MLKIKFLYSADSKACIMYRYKEKENIVHVRDVLDDNLNKKLKFVIR